MEFEFFRPFWQQNPSLLSLWSVWKAQVWQPFPQAAKDDPLKTISFTRKLAKSSVI
jgi:hypothetical protein